MFEDNTFMMGITMLPNFASLQALLRLLHRLDTISLLQREEAQNLYWRSDFFLVQMFYNTDPIPRGED